MRVNFWWRIICWGIFSTLVCITMNRVQTAGTFVFVFWGQYFSLFASLAYIVPLLLTSNRKSFRCVCRQGGETDLVISNVIPEITNCRHVV